METNKQANDLEFAIECYTQGFLIATKCLLERIYDNNTYEFHSIHPFVALANRLPTVMQSGIFTLEDGSIKFIPNREPVNKRPLLNLTRFDFVCDSCGHEFWKQELKRYPEKEGDPIQCPHCDQEKITRL